MEIPDTIVISPEQWKALIEMNTFYSGDVVYSVQSDIMKEYAKIFEE